MRWLAKAALQRTLGALPQGERLNYVFQRHVLHSFPLRDAAYRQKFTRAVSHLALYEEHGPGVPTAEATFFEFGAGWDLAIPLSYALLGVGRQIVIDIRPSARIELGHSSTRRSTTRTGSARPTTCVSFARPISTSSSRIRRGRTRRDARSCRRCSSRSASAAIRSRTSASRFSPSSRSRPRRPRGGAVRSPPAWPASGWQGSRLAGRHRPRQPADPLPAHRAR